MLTLTPELTRRLLPRRAIPASIPRRRFDAAAQTKIWAELRKSAEPEAWARGLEASGPTLAPKIEAAQRAVATGVLPDDPEDLAALEALFYRTFRAEEERSIVRLVAARDGVAAAVAMKSRSLELARESSPGRHRLFEDPHISTADHRVFRNGSWNALRELVCAASDEAYAAAVRVIRARFDATGALAQRRFLSFVAPDEHDLANAVLSALVAQHPLPTLVGALDRVADLFSASDDQAAIVRFIESAIADPACTSYELRQIFDASAELAATLDEESFARVARLLVAQKTGKTELRSLAVALSAREEDPSAASVLASALAHPVLGPVAVTYFQRNGGRVATALAPIAEKSGKAGEAARLLLSRARAEQSLDANGVDTPSTDEVPALLRNPPWLGRKEKRAKGASRTVEVAVPLVPASVVIPDEWRAQIAVATAIETPMGPQLAVDWSSLPLDQRRVDFVVMHGRRFTPPAEALHSWNEERDVAVFDPLLVLARFGTAAAPGFFLRIPRLVEPGSGDARARLFRAAMCIVAPPIARVAAFALAHRPGERKRALGWLLANPAVAAAGLVPIAVGPVGHDRDDAEAALSLLAEAGHVEAVRAASDAFGAETREIVDEHLGRDPASRLVVRGELAASVDVASLAVRTRSGARLPEPAVRNLLDLLRSVPEDVPCRALDTVAASLDGASLRALADALVTTWEMTGARGIDRWMPATLVRFGGAPEVARFGLLARSFAQRDERKALAAAEILAAIGSDAALSHLAYLSERARHASVRRDAAAMVAAAAERRGLDAESLADRVAPDLELDRDGALHLSFGSRRFVARLTSTFSVSLFDEAGAPLASLPRAAKSDDAKLAKDAKAALSLLTEGLPGAVREASLRLERAMVARRRIAAADFRAFILAHPIQGRLARALVFLTTDPNALAFRVTEDGTLADVDDRPFALADDAFVVVAHVVDLGGEALRWSALFGDYRIAQPFEQLGRTSPVLDETSARGVTLPTYVGVGGSAGAFLGTLDRRLGWVTGAPDVSAFERVVRTRDGNSARVVVSVTGFSLDCVAEASFQVIEEVRLTGETSFESIESLDRFEVLRDLERLRAADSRA